jgi:PilZ domain
VTERRQFPRRKLPFLRGAVLEADGKDHIVTVADLGPDGAFLVSRVPFGLAAQKLTLMVPGETHPVEIPCELVWSNPTFEASSGRPAGIAVRFAGVSEATLGRLRAFASRSEWDRRRDAFEYRLVDREPSVEELDRLGSEGWLLAASLPASEGVRLVFVRRL